jgi:sugar lactone lactonase YvrE
MLDRLHRKSATRYPRRWAILPVLTYLVTTGYGAAAAHATNFGVAGEFGEQGTAVGQFAPSESPKGIAVDARGDVWVVDGGNARVQKLEPSGSSANPLLAFGWGVETGASEFQVCTSSCRQGLIGPELGEFGVGGFGLRVATGMAVEPGEPHNVFVVDTANRRVEKFAPKPFAPKVEPVLQFDGSETPAATMEYPWGVAADASGHVYVMDAGAQVVDRFSAATGKYESQIAGSETPQGAFSVENFAFKGTGNNLAVDSSGDLYVGDDNHNVVDEFTPAGKYLRQFKGVIGNAVAVDSEGHIFAANGSSVEEFDPAVSLTSPVAEFGSGPVGYLAGIATSGSGLSERVYVTDQENHKVWVFGPVATPECTTEPAEHVGAGEATLTGTVNPNGSPATYRFKYDSTSGGGETSLQTVGEGTSAVKVSGFASSLQPHQTYAYQLVATNTNGQSLCGNQTLETLPEAPVVSSEQVPTFAISQTAATLEALVNPNNEETHWHVEYATSPSLIGATSLPSPEGEMAARYRDVPISQPASGLAPSTSYYWRAVASNTGGGIRQGAIVSFLTLPSTPATGSASEVASSSATVAGSFNSGGHHTHWYFEYGTAACAPTSCGQRTTEEDGGAGTTLVEAKVALTKLEPLTTYHYRLVVANSTGPVHGPEQEVTTLPQAPAVITSPPAGISASSAVLAGEVVPQCAQGRYPPTTYRFEYGTSTAYGASSEETAVTASSCATGGESVTMPLAGLASDTVYHFRLDAKNGGGETRGSDATFTTNAASQPGSTLQTGFSLTGTAPAGPAAVTFASLAAFAPTPPASSGTKGSTSAASTRVQRLSKALRACKKDKGKAKRAKCEKEARAKYGLNAKKR